MVPRDRVREIVEIGKRSVRHVPSITKFDLDHLADVWKLQLKDVEVAGALVPIRIVTLLEVFVRGWIEQLVNEGAPYVERAAKLSIGLKFDFAIASSLHGRIVTLGQLIAHSTSISRLESIVDVLEKLLHEEDLFSSISTVRSRWAIEVEGKPDLPIIADIGHVKSSLFRLFEARHILVHEMPRKKVVTADDVDDFLDSAALFVQALDEMLSARLHGKYPLTQREMNSDSALRSAEAREELKEVCEKITHLYDSSIFNVQHAWQIFVEAEAQRQSDVASGGSMQPMIYHTAVESLTRARITELKRWIEEGEVE
jgi:uncharacterized protein YecT (DUF1311 family)